ADKAWNMVMPAVFPEEKAQASAPFSKAVNTASRALRFGLLTLLYICPPEYPPSSLRKKVVERLIGAVTSPVDAWLMFPLCMAMVSGFICFILFGRVYVMHVAKYKYMKRILVIAAILCSSLMVLQSCSSTSNTAS